jgi:hypothetical protein
MDISSSSGKTSILFDPVDKAIPDLWTTDQSTGLADPTE